MGEEKLMFGLYDFAAADSYIKKHVDFNESIEAEILYSLAFNRTYYINLNDILPFLVNTFTLESDVIKSLEVLTKKHLVFLKKNTGTISYMTNHLFLPTVLLQFALTRSSFFDKYARIGNRFGQNRDIFEIKLFSALGLRSKESVSSNGKYNAQDLRLFQGQYINVHFSNRLLFYKIFNLKEAWSLIEGASRDVLDNIFANAIFYPTMQGLECTELFETFEKKIIQNQLCSLSINEMYFQLLFLKGDFSKRINLLEPSVESKSRKIGIESFLKGDLENSTKAAKNMSRFLAAQFSSNCEQDILDVILVLVWVLSAEQTGFKRILKAIRNDSAFFCYPLTFLDEIQNYINGRHEYLASIDIPTYALHQISRVSMDDPKHCQNYFSNKWNDLKVLIDMLFLFWFDSERFSTCKGVLEGSFIRHQECGNKWLAFEFGQLLLELEPETPIKKSIEALSAELGVYSLKKLYKHVSVWERKLNQLMSVSKKVVTEKKERRLFWCVDSNYGSIKPIIREKGKDGWRVVSVRAYLEATKQKPYLGLQNINLLLNSFDYRDELYRSDTEYGQTIMELIGHPFLINKKDEKIEFSIANIYVEITETENIVKVSFNKILKAPNVGDVHIEEVTKNNFEVFQFTPKINEIFKIIGNEGLTIPKESKDLLVKALRGISSEIAILSNVDDISFNNGTTINGSSEMLIRLWPYQNGLEMEAFISPFSSSEKEFVYDQFLVKPGVGSKQVIEEIDNEKVIAKRQFDAEIKALELLIELNPCLDSTQNSFCHWLFAHPNDALELVESLKNLSGGYRIEWPKGENFKIKGEAESKSFNISVTSKEDWFEINGEIKFNDGSVYSLKKMLQLLEVSKSRFIALDEKKFLSISKELKKKLDDIAWVCHVKNDQLQANKFSVLALEETFAGINHLGSDDAWREVIKSAETAKKYIPVLPKTLEATLRTYQIDGYKWLSRLASWGVGACLADDMGLGKTIQAITILLERALLGPALIIAPVSVGDNWLLEINKFAPTLNPILMRNLKPEEITNSEVDKPFQVIICTYGLMQQRIENLQEIHFSTIVLDEAQAIKNHNTKRFKAAILLKGSFKILTTGTPIENHLMELWSLFYFINPGLLGTKGQFLVKFFGPIHKNKDLDAQKYLKQLIQPFILRRLKKEVLTELPEKTEINRFVEMSTLEVEFYESVRQLGVERIESGLEDGEHKALQVLAEISKLRRACCHPKLIAPELKIPSAKMIEFDSIVDELLANNHKALVFSQFVGFLKIIEAHVKKRNIPYQYLDGSTPASKRQELVDKFQSGEGDLFLISLKAGGSGLNLTAANFVIHMDPWWNPAVEDQATDRTHRIGQKHPVTVYRVITKGTIEEKILNMHEAKRDIADTILEGSEGIGKLNTNDLLDLLKENLKLVENKTILN